MRCKHCGGEIYHEGFGDGEVLRRCSECDEIADTQDAYSRITRTLPRQDDVPTTTNRDKDRRNFRSKYK